MTNEHTHTQDAALSAAKSNGWNIFLPENRGMLFDIIIFLINLLFMGAIADAFIAAGRNAYSGQRLAQLGVFVFFILLFAVQPIGAQFKRWQFHQRRRAGRRRKSRADAYIFTFSDNILLAIVFNPVLHFATLLFVSLVITSYLSELVTGKKNNDDDSVFIVYVLVAFLITVVHSVSVYRYFTSPTKEPKNKLLYGSSSGLIGDLFVFADILAFQIMWNIMGQIPSQGIHTLGDYIVRSFFLVSMALAVYLPSRIFYFAEDIKKPLAWITILLAISPLIIRFLSS